VSLAEVMRRLLFLWLVEDLELPQDADYLSLMDAMADYYAEQANG